MDGGIDDPAEASKLLEAALEQMDGIIQGAKFDFPITEHQSTRRNNHLTETFLDSSSSLVSTALQRLRDVIKNMGSKPKVSINDENNIQFINRWFSSNFAHLVQASGQTNGNDGLQVRVEVLTEQLEAQSLRLSETERILAAKKDLLVRTEQALDQERQLRLRIENEVGHYSEFVHLKNRCNVLEQENEELRKICVGNRTQRYLPLSPEPRPRGLPVASPEGTTTSPTSGSEDVVDHSDLVRSPSGRPPRVIRKFFGKIKRSNSGGQLDDSRILDGGQQQQQQPQPFRRGGYRATTGGRLGTLPTPEPKRGVEFPRNIQEWTNEVIVKWLEALGLAVYCSDAKKSNVTGEMLQGIGHSDLETKFAMRNALHRKKVLLDLTARREGIESDGPGKLDFLWVSQWLDDLGLAQYKDAFLEARIDGRVLNVLTVDELIGLKVTTQLHHLSIRRGIQVLRSHNFRPDCFIRRAVAGENLTPANVARWSNVRLVEWLKQVDLAEYSSNLRLTGVHGGLIVHEPRFTDDVFGRILSIPSSKTLLRRHLNIHFKELVGRDAIQSKRNAEQAPDYVALNMTAKAKPRAGGQFSLKRKKSKSQLDFTDLICPIENHLRDENKLS